MNILHMINLYDYIHGKTVGNMKMKRNWKPYNSY